MNELNPELLDAMNGFTPGSREWYASRIFGTGQPVNAAKQNKEAVDFGLSMAPVTGEAMSLKDAWTASGKGAEALQGGNYGQAAGEYANLLTALMGAAPGVGVIARGTKRGTDWMNRNMPEGVNKLLDAMTPSDPKNTMNIFAGPTAKTADHAALSQAQELATQGASRDDIWKQTGWFQGVDGKWRFEIPDNEASLQNVQRLPANPESLFGDAPSGTFTDMTHPDFVDAYGPTPRIAGEYGPLKSVSGQYDPITGNIVAKGPTEDRALSTSLHELQHWVQARENFAPGGNWRQVLQTPEAKEAVQVRFQQMKASGANLSDEDILSNAESQIAREMYNRLAGEVEARNVQTRLPMTAAERRAKAPWETQDVPDDMQIVRFGGNNPAMSTGRRLTPEDYKNILEAQRETEGLRAAMRDPETGKIYTGRSHQDAIDKVPPSDESGAWGRLHGEWDRSTENTGYIDRKGKFITRDEAEKRWGVLTMEDLKDLRAGKRPDWR